MRRGSNSHTKIAFIFHFCIINYYKYSSLKQHLFIISEGWKSQVHHDVLDLLLRILQDQDQGTDRAAFLSEGSGGRMELIQIVGRIQLLAVVWLRSRFPWHLALSIFKPSTCVESCSYITCLWFFPSVVPLHLPFVSSTGRRLCFKGSHDYLRLT